MGCVYSHPRHSHHKTSNASSSPTSNQNSKIFQVCNVDDSGNEISHGKIEINENELSLHQRGRTTIYWPLRSLRRYGFDAESFSFECGRRCPTGPGIYVFKCQQAEQLFNTLQEAIQSCSSQSTSFPYPAGGPIIGLTNQASQQAVPTTPTEQQASSSPGPFSGPGPGSGSFQSTGQTGSTNTNAISNCPSANYTNCTPPLDGGTPVPGSVSVPGSATGHKSFSFSLSSIPRLSQTSNSLPPSSHTYTNGIHQYINSPFYVNTTTSQTANNNCPGQSPPGSGQLPTGQAQNTRSKTNINTNYAKLDDLVKYYVNIKTPMTASQTNENQSQLSSQTTGQIPTTSQSGQSTGSPIRISFSNESINYVTLDLEPQNQSYMSCDDPASPSPTSKSLTMDFTTGSITGSFSGPSAGFPGPGPSLGFNSGSMSQVQAPSTPTSLTRPNSLFGCSPQQYAQIDFGKTQALHVVNSTANHRKIV